MWFLKERLGGGKAVPPLDRLPRITAWSERMKAIGSGSPTEMSAAEALAGKASVAEGAATAPVLADLARREGLDLPIVDAVSRLLAGEAPAATVVAELLARPLRAEQGHQA